MTPAPTRKPPGRRPDPRRSSPECTVLDAMARGARLTCDPARGHSRWRLVLPDGTSRPVESRTARLLTVSDDPAEPEDAALLMIAEGVWAHPCAQRETGRAV